MYWQAVTVIEAQDALVQLTIADYPHMKQEQRNKAHRQFHRLAYPKTYESGETLTTEQLAAKLKAVLNG